MALFYLILGIICVWCSGAITSISLNEKKFSEIWMAVVSLILGIYLLVSSIGAALQ